jgi:hypothetical protein
MPNTHNTTQFEIVSDEMQEIIGYIPNWVTRWGITVLSCLLLILIFVSKYISYPDVLIAPAEILSKQQPFKASWFRSEQFMSYNLKTKENQVVKKGDTLLIEDNLKTHQTQVIVSPISGKVFLTKGYQENAKKQTIWVMPKINDFEVQLKVPIKKSGKVRVGQRVQISLDEYPANEFGYLEGKILDIIPIKIENAYRVNVALDKKLISNTGVSIPDQPNYIGSAEIISSEKSVLERIFGDIFRKS